LTEKIEIEEKRRWLYKKLKEYRSIDSLNERLDILEEIVKQGYKNTGRESEIFGSDKDTG